MRSCACVLITAALAACSSRTVTERERALERIPAQAQVIAAADGPALSTATFKLVIDAARPHVPTSLGCVLDAANTSDAIAVGARADVGATIVIITRATVASCPALSRLGDRVYAATIGAGALATSRADSALVDPSWERARPYLLREPFALAAELPSHRVIAVAQPEPVDAWVAIDATDAANVEQAIKAMIARYVAPRSIELAGKLTATRAGTQVNVQSEGLTAEELALVVTDTLRELERAGTRAAPASAITCPPPTNAFVSCHDGTQFKLSSVEAVIRELAEVPSAPVIAGGDIIGIRLIGQPRRILDHDDVILGLGSHRITSSAQLGNLAGELEGKAVLAVRRAGNDVVFDLSE